jgi:hypothetical protein
MNQTLALITAAGTASGTAAKYESTAVNGYRHPLYQTAQNAADALNALISDEDFNTHSDVYRAAATAASA